jgi:hypothetical protein
MKARFFCDSCGASVGARTDRCPACGKVFAAVRCPKCGYEGKPSDFGRGCPVCGYLASGEAGPTKRSPSRARSEFPLSPTAARLVGGLLVLLLAVLMLIIVRR